MLKTETNSSVDRLTAQERQCLRLVAQNLSSKEIARKLGISKASVDTYCNRARLKLDAPDRRAAARMVQMAEGFPVGLTTPTMASADRVRGRFGPTLPPMEELSWRRRIALSVLCAMVLALAFGTLLSGLGALNTVAKDAIVARHQAALSTTETHPQP
jgi:DNA-binding CsgD family transcriptional regulator